MIKLPKWQKQFDCNNSSAATTTPLQEQIVWDCNSCLVVVVVQVAVDSRRVRVISIYGFFFSTKPGSHPVY